MSKALNNIVPSCRSILWTGEEVGIVGAADYQRDHAANEKEEFNFFIESDIGTFG